MSWTNPITWVASQLVTAALMNQQVRDNLSALWPYTTQGDFAYRTATALLGRLGIGTADQMLTVNAGATAPEWSNLRRTAMFIVFASDDEVESGDGVFYWRVPALLDGMDLVGTPNAACNSAPTGSGITIQLHNETQAADMLTTEITIDAGETDSKDAATPPVIDTNNDDVSEGDIIRIDVDQVGSTLAGDGLQVTLDFELP